MKKVSLVTALLFVTAISAFAQNDSPDFMRSIGKIYVVVAVIIVVFLGIVAFLIYLDRKLTKLEDQIKEND
ncbi:MAG: CcmD family protein [Bacteroidota bacterium]